MSQAKMMPEKRTPFAVSFWPKFRVVFENILSGKLCFFSVSFLRNRCRFETIFSCALLCVLCVSKGQAERCYME